MDIQNDVKKFLESSGWTAKRLAQEAGVEPSTITRLVRGDRKGVHSTTLEKLWPIIHGPVPAASAEAPAPAPDCPASPDA